MGKFRAIPVLMQESELSWLKEAIDRSKRSLDTIARRCRQSGIGRQEEPSAPWQISAVSLEAKQYEVTQALDDLRGGDFTTQRGRRYVERLGLE